MARVDPHAKSFLSSLSVNDYESFLQYFYEHLDLAITYLQENRQYLQNDTEDRLTVSIVGFLRGRGFEASHDTKIGGHVDLVVKSKINNYLWLGEAKIRSGNANLWEGFLQLCTRYSTGDVNQAEGGLLIYIHQSNATEKMAQWKQALSLKELSEYSSEPCSIRSPSFFSVHNHEGSGQKFRVRHMPVMLHFSPQDKSGRSKKKS